MRKHLFAVSTLILAFVVILFLKETHSRAEKRIAASLQTSFQTSSGSLITPDMVGSWRDESTRRRRVLSVLRSGLPKSVGQLKPFLGDESSYVRDAATYSLAAIGTPEALNYLRAYVANTPMDFRAKWFLASAESRSKKGRDRLESVCQSVKLSFNDVPEISRRLARDRAWAHGSLGEFVVQGVVDLLYAMGKGGENVEPLERGLVLTHSQRVKLDCAILDDDAEIQYLLNDISKPALEIGATEEAATLLIRIGPRVRTPLLRRLELLKQNPSEYTRADIYRSLFYVLGSIDPDGSIDVLQSFKVNSPSYIQKIADSSIRMIRLKKDPGRSNLASGQL